MEADCENGELPSFDGEVFPLRLLSKASSTSCGTCDLKHICTAKRSFSRSSSRGPCAGRAASRRMPSSIDRSSARMSSCARLPVVAKSAAGGGARYDEPPPPEPPTRGTGKCSARPFRALSLLSSAAGRAPHAGDVDGSGRLPPRPRISRFNVEKWFPARLPALRKYRCECA